MDQKWSPVQVLGKYFGVYGQNSPITPEAGKKRLLFWTALMMKRADCWNQAQNLQTQNFNQIIGI